MSELTRKPLQIWSCKIGECPDDSLPNAADGPMRDAVADAYERISGHKPAFIFSGWNAELSEGERAAHENRLPQPAMTDRARVTELERALKLSETTYSQGYNQVAERNAQLQATLAAREARIAELVEGLRTIAYADWSPELNKEISAAMERGELKHMTGVEWLAQRLLTQLEAHRKEGV